MQLSDWKGALVIGLKYGDNDATVKAKAVLNELLRPSHKLHLLMAHNVAELQEWIRPAISSLLTCPKGTLTAEDYNILGGTLIQHIISVRTELERHRNYMVIKIFEGVHSNDHCPTATQVKCAAAWGLAWVAAARVHICNEAEEGVAMMRRLSEMQIPNMTRECHDMTLSSLAHSGLLHRYARIIEKGVEEITKLL